MGISILTDGQYAVMYDNTTMKPLGFPLVDDREFFASAEDACNDLLAWCPLVIGTSDPRFAGTIKIEQIVADWNRQLDIRREQFESADTDGDDAFLTAIRESGAAPA